MMFGDETPEEFGSRKNFVHSRIVRSGWWTAMTLVFTLILLFGPEARVLWVPKAYDRHVDMFFLCVFGILVVDILVRCYASPGYFQTKAPRLWSSPRTCPSVGSFMFWCDFFSTVILLSDITFIPNDYYDRDRVLVDFSGDSSSSSGIVIDWYFLLSVCRSARIARFARASAFVSASRINFYDLFFNQVLAPCRGRELSDCVERCCHRVSGGGERMPRNEAATIIQTWWRGRMVTEDFVFNRTSDRPGARMYQDRSTRRTSKQRRKESQVGSEMRELTSQRVALGIMLALVLSSVLDYKETDDRVLTSVIMLHDMTRGSFGNNGGSSVDNVLGDVASLYRRRSVHAARKSSLPTLYNFTYSDGTFYEFADVNWMDLRDNEILEVTVCTLMKDVNETSVALVSKRRQIRDTALMELLNTAFILIVWFFGVVAFAGPVMSLVVLPIERMIKLLGMLTADPLGYQQSPEFRKFVMDEDKITRKTTWTREVLKGMETSFLMSTIVRIGSLMKVGFGNAGVEIIRHNLSTNRQTGQGIGDGGITVSCIFLFCDIRQFTDATECLQEEVFVFTNKIAAVVHSICSSYGGSANKNIGDAFLLSWMLSDDVDHVYSASHGSGRRTMDSVLDKIHNADKALLSVIKINLSLHHDKYFLQDMSEAAKDRLLTKLADRAGPVVQIGFGLHFGKAVQGAIGTQRKLDASFVSETVEMAETLESSTKRYGVKVLMSESFYLILSQKVKQFCRKIDRVLVGDADVEIDFETEDLPLKNIYTYDMDIDAVWVTATPALEDGVAGLSDSFSVAGEGGGGGGTPAKTGRRVSDSSISIRNFGRRSGTRTSRKLSSPAGTFSFGLGLDLGGGGGGGGGAPSAVDDAASSSGGGGGGGGGGGAASTNHHVGSNHGRSVDNLSSDEATKSPPELVLPNGAARYNSTVWDTPEMKRIRAKYSDGEIIEAYDLALKCYYLKDWEQAQLQFKHILSIMEDGPSRYFLNCIIKHNRVPPVVFPPYATL